jgi:hypothetical protein
MVSIANSVEDGWIQTHLPEGLAHWLLAKPRFAVKNDVTLTSLGWCQPTAPTGVENVR